MKKTPMLPQKTIFKVLLYLIIPLSILPNLNGQDCIDYPDLEGAPCQDCAPAGWIETNLFLIFVNIIPPSSGSIPGTTCNVSQISGPSPSGGNVVMLTGDVDWPNQTTIETTISGLNAGQSYVFGMYWEEFTRICGGSENSVGGILQMTIDDQLYEFEDAPDWELAEVCFTPSSSSIEVIISTTTTPFQETSAIIIDGNFDCSISTACCSLTLDTDNNNYSVCPGESFVLDANYADAAGPVQIEWTCDPPEGLNYLSSTDAISPEFTFPLPPLDFDGETFKYSLSVGDNFCTQTIECIEVEVQPIISPVFDFDLCDLDLIAPLPMESDNGYTGTWTGDFDIESQGGNTVSFLFTIDDGQNNCVEPQTFDFFVFQGYTPTFDIVEVYCLTDTTDYILPTESEQLNFGQWIPNTPLNPSELGEGMHSFLFVPNPFADNNFCVNNYELNIEVVSNTTLTFNLPEQFCTESSFYILPQTSIEGVSGMWTQDSIDLSIPIEDNLLVFTADGSNDCASEFNYEYSVLENTLPTFSILDSYCSNDTIFTLPESSDNSIMGSWNVNLVDPSLQDSLVIIFTPESGGCYEDFSQTLYFTEFKNPIFDIPFMVCEDEAPFIFPTISQNGITGSWTQDTLDPSMVTQNTFSNTFTPDDPTCTSDFSVTIEILSFENVALESTDPSSCEVNDGFIQIIGASPEMQLSLDNGMTWGIVADIENLSSGTYNIQIRFESLPSCSYDFTAQLSSSESPIILDVNTTNPSSCGLDDGIVECISEGNNLEYSIDSISWVTSNTFENLVQGNYDIYVRKADQVDCVSSFSFELLDPIIDEICDGIDNNCNGEVDEGLATENYYADKDMDNFGDLNDLIVACQQPQGYVLDSTDCDDDNNEIFPGADEVPNNGIDEDCDGADLTTSVNELAGQKVDIYPNPTNGLVTIEIKENRDIKLALYDMNGRLLIHKNQTNTLDLSEYKNGVYLIKITDLNSFESIVERIVLNK